MDDALHPTFFDTELATGKDSDQQLKKQSSDAETSASVDLNDPTVDLSVCEIPLEHTAFFD